MNPPALDLSALNDNQREAVQWSGAGLLVLAGPGSGKTRVLTLRIAKLLLDRPDLPYRVLALTFTKKAAGEMRNRVVALVPNAGTRTRLSTFHGFAVDLLRQHGSHLGLKPEFRVIEDQGEREELMAEVMAEVPGIFEGAEAVLKRVGDLADCGLARDEVDARCAAIGERLLPVVYRRYFGLLLKRQSLDFPGLILSAVTTLRKYPAVGNLIRTVYPYVCVDEFQDSNEGQYRLLRELIGTDPSRLFVVADDDQLIYRWRGASPERVEALRRDFSVDTIQLPTNYRCPPAVIEIANCLIIRNSTRSPGKTPLVADKKRLGDEVVRVREFELPQAEIDWVAGDIQTRRLVGPCRCAVLGRTKKIVEPVMTKLRALGVPATLVVRRDHFTSAPTRWLHALLLLRLRGFDRRQVARACGAFQQLTGSRLDARAIELEEQASPGSVLSAFLSAARRSTDPSPETLALLDSARRHLVEGNSFLQLCREAWPVFDVCEAGAAGNTAFQEYAEEREAWVGTQAETVREFGERDLSLGAFLQELSVGARMPATPDGVVQCMTIHAAKGLEFEHVYLIGLAEDVLPGFQAVQKGDGSPEMEEERRSCFVAITRTELTLTLTRATSYYGRAKAPSRFLAEMEG